MAEKIILEALCPHKDHSQQAETLRRIADHIAAGDRSGLGWRITETDGDV